MQLNLWRDFSKKNNSTAIPSSRPDDVFTNIRLKEDCSTINPVLILTHGTFGANYTYAQWKGRYYFVKDIVSVNNATFEVHLSVDVLGTYRSNINSYTAFVERCQDSDYYDTMLVDPLIARSSDIYQINKTTKNTQFIGDDSTYFFRVVSGEGIITYITPWPEIMQGIMFPATGESSWEAIKNDIWTATYNPINYLLDYYAIPIGFVSFEDFTLPANIRWGFHTSPNNGTHRINQAGSRCGATETITGITLPSSGYDDFRKYDSNWTKYYIWLPLLGLQEVPSQYADDTFELVYEVDAFSGDCVARLRTTEDEGAPIASFSANIKVQLQQSQVTTDWGSFYSATAGSFSDALTLNFGGMVSDIWQEQKAINQPMVNVVGSPSGNAYSAYKHDNVTTFAISYKSKDIPITKAGRPCCRNLSLGNLSGYVKCAGSSISIPGTDTERDMINAYLNGGFYRE